MDYNLKFSNQLKDGQKGEIAIMQYLAKKGYKLIHFNDTMDYDILLEKNGIETTVEIKTDRYETLKGFKTNNLFLEVMCNGKPSGVIGTKAIYFIYYYPDYEKCYMITINELRHLLQYQPGLFIRKSHSGDKGRVTGYVINRDIAKNYFKVIDIPMENWEWANDYYERKKREFENSLKNPNNICHL